MKKLKPLHYKYFRQQLLISKLQFKNTNEIKPLSSFIGQERALQALNFGIGIKSNGYNLYAMGPPGIGKHALVRSVLKPLALKEKIPSDWCYVYNFKDPEKPLALQLPPGMGFLFQKDMKRFIQELETNILKIFQREEYRLSISKIQHYYEKKRNQAKKNHRAHENILPSIYREQHRKEKILKLKVTASAVNPSIKKIKIKYKNNKAILKYLKSVHTDIFNHIDDLIKHDEKNNLLTFSSENLILTKYTVNLLVDNRKRKGAPVIFEDSPTYDNLIGRMEHTTTDGLLTTNFSLIRPGSIHRANGGYLIIEARKLKKNIDAWEALKNTLVTNKITLKPLSTDSESIKTVSLEPTNIPLKIKIILIGSRQSYYRLCEKDPDFISLFKVPVDFDDDIKRDRKNIHQYARLIKAMICKHKLKSFHASAVAYIIDYSTRLADDIEKLSTHIVSIEDLVIESDYWATKHLKKIVHAVDVKYAISAQIYRKDRAKLLYYEDIHRNFIIIKTSGWMIGQINCLSVRRVGDYSYGHPTRLSARVRLGKGKIIDIQREVDLAGPLHSKGSLIIASFLASQFNNNQPFALSASIAFEQIYVWTEGDSASLGEICILLSALSDLPITQSLAVTGSIDQYGAVQAIGGVNEKIEGFFDICNARGLTGNQGVIIPAINIKNLMLKEEIIKAAKNHQFHIYPVTNVDEAIQLLTGCKTGQRDRSGHFNPNTIYYKIEEKLKIYLQDERLSSKK